MKHAPLLALAAVAFAACSDNPAGAPPDPVESFQVVITEGVPAPAPALQRPMEPRLSELAASANLGGSTTTPVSLNGQNCTTFPAQAVTVTYTITGNQGSAASFKVNTKWVYDGSGFVGSTPTTVNVPARAPSDPATIVPVAISVENGTTGGTGATSFTIEPFGVLTTAPAALTVTGGNVTVHVEFTTCVSANTPPALVLPANMTVEATSAAGAVVTFQSAVTASDAQDGDLSDDVVCDPASGSTFPLGETTVECSVTDSGGMDASGTFTIKVVDTTAPVFSGVPTTDVVLIAANINGAALDIADLGISAADVGNVSPPVSISCSPAEGTVLAIGSQTLVSCTATDNSSHPAPNTSAPVSFKVIVTLNVGGGGFLSPLRMAAPFSAHKLASTVPHKLPPPTYADGTPALDLASGLRLVLTKVAGGESYEQETAADYSTGSTAWRYDSACGCYIFNLQTQKSWGQGDWETSVSYAGVKLAHTYLSFRK